MFFILNIKNHNTSRKKHQYQNINERSCQIAAVNIIDQPNTSTSL